MSRGCSRGYYELVGVDVTQMTSGAFSVKMPTYQRCACNCETCIARAQREEFLKASRKEEAELEARKENDI